MDDANAQIRAFNARKDYRTAGIAKAAEALTEDSVEDDKRERLMRLMDGVTKDEVVSAMRRYGNEFVKRRQNGREVPKLRWSADTQRRRIGKMLMLMRDW